VQQPFALAQLRLEITSSPDADFDGDGRVDRERDDPDGSPHRLQLADHAHSPQSSHTQE